MAEQLTFRTSRSKGFLVLVLSWCFVALGFWLVSEGERLFGWLFVGFFGLGIPASLTMMFSPNAMYLRLDPEGFEMGSFIKKVRVRWTDVRGFEMRSLYHNKMIAIIYAPHYSEQKIGRAVAATLSGMQGGIANHYDAPLDEILRTLNEWRVRYGGRSQEHHPPRN
jgi:hypothetical protein